MTEHGIITAVEGMYRDIGAVKDLPVDPRERKQFLIRTWEMVTSKNPAWPVISNEHTDLLASRFFTALITGEAERKGNNISAICAAFKEWLTYDRQMVVMNTYYELYPNRRPTDKRSRTDNIPLEKWADHVIRDQYKKIQELFGNSSAQAFQGIPGSKNYFQRIAAEYNRRFNPQQQPAKHHHHQPTPDYA